MRMAKIVGKTVDEIPAKKKTRKGMVKGSNLKELEKEFKDK